MVDRETQSYLRQVVKQVGEKIDGVVFSLERKANATFNIFNVLVRLLEHIGIEQKWWANRDEFQARFQLVAEELTRESKEIEAKQRQEIRDAQAAGETPKPMDGAEMPMSQLIKVVRDAVEKS